MKTPGEKELTVYLEEFMQEWEAYKQELFKTVMSGQTYYKNKNMFIKDPVPCNKYHLRQEIHFFHINELVDMEINPVFQIIRPFDIRLGWFNLTQDSKQGILDYAKVYRYRVELSPYLNVGL